MAGSPDDRTVGYNARARDVTRLADGPGSVAGHTKLDRHGAERSRAGSTSSRPTAILPVFSVCHPARRRRHRPIHSAFDVCHPQRGPDVVPRTHPLARPGSCAAVDEARQQAVPRNREDTHFRPFCLVPAVRVANPTCLPSTQMITRVPLRASCSGARAIKTAGEGCERASIPLEHYSLTCNERPSHLCTSWSYRSPRLCPSRHLDRRRRSQTPRPLCELLFACYMATADSLQKFRFGNGQHLDAASSKY